MIVVTIDSIQDTRNVSGTFVIPDLLKNNSLSGDTNRQSFSPRI